MKGIIQLNIKEGNKISNKLIRICKYICNNYNEIKKELLQISNSLELAKGCAVSYIDMNIAKMNFDNYNEKIETEYLKSVVESLGKIDEEFCNEFMQGINVFDLSKQIFTKKDRGEIIKSICQSNEIIQYIFYQLDRIYKAKTINKKLAILKGMIAYN